MLNRASQHGVTLIELMVGIAVLSIVLAVGMPMFGLWVQNSQVRAAAESIQNGLQIARTEAIRRNTNVRFTLTSAEGLVQWNVGCVTVRGNCPATIQQRNAAEGGANARAGVDSYVQTDPSDPDTAPNYSAALTAGAGLGGVDVGVTFNALGLVTNSGTDIARVDVLNSSSADARRLVITIGAGGQTRMCDPALTLANNPQGCS